jgi:hypothetical protein
MSRNRSYLPEPNLIIHCYNWAVDGRDLFQTDSDYELYLQLLRQVQKIYPVTVILYALLPKRFDLILRQLKPFALSEFMRRVCHTYALLVNKRLRRKGLLFDGRFHGTPINDPEELLNCSFALHQSPAATGLVPTSDQWPYTSRQSCLDRTGTFLNDPSLVLALTGGPEKYASLLRHFTQKGPCRISDFLCRDSEEIWSETAKKKFRPHR